jgi:undecaprenyl diphosphate synthase
MNRPSTLPVNDSQLPRHIAIVMDGNGRWAVQRKKPRSFGHQAGLRATRKTIESCLSRGIKTLTLFAFSSENWARPKPEVNALISLFLKALDREVNKLKENGIRLRFIGDWAPFPKTLQQRMQNAQLQTQTNTLLHVNIAVNYGGRWDITQACTQIADAALSGELDPKKINESTIQSHLSLHDLVDPDLFIRTGGERRISNFLIWQLAYAELYFTDTLWPDFDDLNMAQALEDFTQRERRYGKTSAQLGSGA